MNRDSTLRNCPWRFAELKHDSANGIDKGMSQIRDRFRNGAEGPAQLYLWSYDSATGYTFTPYGGLRFPRGPRPGQPGFDFGE